MKKSEIDNKHNAQFGILSAIAIILVVMGHSGFNGVTFNGLFNYDSFHIPLFVFISGYFFKSDVSYKNAKFYFIKKIKKFLIPFFIWNIIYGILAYYLREGFGIWYNSSTLLYIMFIRPFTNGNCFFGFNDPSWFLLMLFNVQILDYCLRLLFNKFSNKQILILIISLVLSLLSVTFTLNFNGAYEYVIVTRTLYMLFFFECGSIYKLYIEKYDYINNTKYFLIIFAFQLILLFLSGYNGTIAGIWKSEFHNSGILTILLALNGIAFYLRISRLLVPILTQNKLVNYISKNTFTIMMHHVLGFFITNCIWFVISLNSSIINFDKQLFKTELWYKTLPYNNEGFLIIYVIMGIAIPLFLHKIFSKLKEKNILNTTLIMLKNKLFN